MTRVASLNPATEEGVKSFPLHGPAEIDGILEAAAGAQRVWRRTEIAERAALLTRIAVALRADAETYARLITAEIGKPITEARAEIEKCAVTLDHYAADGARILADEIVGSNATESRITYEPLGVVLAVMPWNYPFWQFFRFAAPALVAGNGTILKHANNVPRCALAIAEVIRRSGAPEGLCGTIFVETPQVADLIGDDRIAAVTFTGSTAVGRAIAAQAGAALKKHVLELGGSDPFIVLADADVAVAASTAVRARFINAGQSCVNAKRFIVEDAVAEEFVEAFVEHVRTLRVGDPELDDTDLGPLARADLRDHLHSQVVRTVRGTGAQLRHGGEPLPGRGFFYAPTVIDRVSPGDAAFAEETFGPLAAIARARDSEHAITLANNTPFGLGASVWTGDPDRAEEIVRRLDAGAVFVNGMVASDARLPFGGIKASGYGRELGDVGLREFVNIKTVWIGPAV